MKIAAHSIAYRIIKTLPFVILSVLCACGDDNDPATPVFLSITPPYGLPGDIVTITGEHLSGNYNFTVTVNGTIAAVQPGNTDTQLKISIPANATSGKIAMTNAATGTAVTSADDFEVLLDIPRTGLVAFYPFTGNANDLSGHHLDGVAGGGSTNATPALATDRFSKSGQSYYFDGVDDLINMGNPELLQIDAPITISAWVKIDGVAALPILSKLYDSYQGAYLIGLGIAQADSNNDNLPHFSFTTVYENGGGDQPFELFLFDKNNWTHFVLTIDEKTTKLYKNGVLKETIYWGNTILTYGMKQGNLIIGFGSISGLHNSFRFFKGGIDDIAIYNRILSDVEATRLFNQTASKY